MELAGWFITGLEHWDTSLADVCRGVRSQVFVCVWPSLWWGTVLIWCFCSLWVSQTNMNTSVAWLAYWSIWSLIVWIGNPWDTEQQRTQEDGHRWIKWRRKDLNRLQKRGKVVNNKAMVDENEWFKKRWQEKDRWESDIKKVIYWRCALRNSVDMDGWKDERFFLSSAGQKSQPGQWTGKEILYKAAQPVMLHFKPITDNYTKGAGRWQKQLLQPRSLCKKP